MYQKAVPLPSEIPEQTKTQLSLVAAPAMRDFALHVEGEYSIIVGASSIEDAMIYAQAAEYPEPKSAHLVEVGDDDNQLDFTVGR